MMKSPELPADGTHGQHPAPCSGHPGTPSTTRVHQETAQKPQKGSSSSQSIRDKEVDGALPDFQTSLEAKFPRTCLRVLASLTASCHVPKSSVRVIAELYLTPESIRQSPYKHRSPEDIG